MRILTIMNNISGRRPTNVTLSVHLVEEANAMDINLSRACENGLEAAVQTERERQWKVNNKEAIEAYNERVAENGVPLEKFRQF